MEDIGYVFSLATFAMVVALWSTMATKKDIRKIIDRETDVPRVHKWRKMAPDIE